MSCVGARRRCAWRLTNQPRDHAHRGRLAACQAVQAAKHLRTRRMSLRWTSRQQFPKTRSTRKSGRRRGRPPMQPARWRRYAPRRPFRRRLLHPAVDWRPQNASERTLSASPPAKRSSSTDHRPRAHFFFFFFFKGGRQALWRTVGHVDAFSRFYNVRIKFNSVFFHLNTLQSVLIALLFVAPGPLGLLIEPAALGGMCCGTLQKRMRPCSVHHNASMACMSGSPDSCTDDTASQDGAIPGSCTACSVLRPRKSLKFLM